MQLDIKVHCFRVIDLHGERHFSNWALVEDTVQGDRSAIVQNSMTGATLYSGGRWSVAGVGVSRASFSDPPCPMSTSSPARIRQRPVLATAGRCATAAGNMCRRVSMFFACRTMSVIARCWRSPMVLIDQIFQRESAERIKVREFLAAIEPDERDRIIQFFRE